MTHAVPGFAPLRPHAIALAVCSVFSVAAFAQATQNKNPDAVLVTATRTPQIAQDVLADNITISSEEIAKAGQMSIVDLLQRKRGIEIARSGGPGTNASVFIRGTDNKQSIVLVDGVRIGTSTTGGATWSAIPLSQVDHIEIVYGPLSSLYGADAVGGVVQIFTKKGEGAPSPIVSTSIGSYASRNLEAGVSGSSGGFHYALRASHEQSDGFSATKPGAGPFLYNPDKDGYKNDGGSGRFSFEYAKDQEVGFTFLNSHLDAQFDSGPGFDDRNLQKLETYALYARNRFAPNWTSDFQVSQSKDVSDSVGSFPSSFNTRRTGISWQNNFFVRNSDVLQVLVEQQKEKVDTTTTALNGMRTTNAVGVAYQMKVSRHLGSVSVRNDNNDQFGSHTTGNVGYGYRVTNALRVNASVGTSFRAPTFNELYYPGFGVPSDKPERGRNAEAGVYYDDGNSELSAVVYRNRITDLLVTAKSQECPIPGNYPFGCAYNVDEAVLRGISLGAKT
ncbi:MAG TPA: TonB-dependent receptor, partial [Noviherbaspirillum sp.]